MLDLYVYYRVRDEHAQQLAPRVRAMQAGLAASHGVHGQLKQRPGSADGVQTWMEIYAGASASFDAALGVAVRDAALCGLIDGKRHTEIFTDIHPCA